MDFDLIIAGGGLAGGLIAYRLATTRPDLRLAVIDSGSGLGGDHTWSFFETDLDPAARRWMEPFVCHRWPGYEVRFPGHARQLGTPYRSVTSDRFDSVLRAALPPGSVLAGVPVRALDPGRVTLADDRVLAARAVIDARGADPSAPLELGFQKFVGLEIETDGPHGLARPIIMDATVPQHDGYRFVYTLPFSPTHLLIEDTYYADGPALDDAGVAERCRAYAAVQGWRSAREVRVERGVLPIALGGDMTRLWAGAPVPKAGMRAALFHPLTGYSLPDAVRAADAVSALPDLGAEALMSALKGLSLRLWEERGFYRLLNRLLFRAAEPHERWRVLERYYRMPEETIGRLYAGRSTWADKARTLIGKPPVPFGRAVAVTLGAK
ncbi:MAG: lycopene beta-cyclase CrtY [Sphingomonadaceae bacterium]|nr:lycopene beta-cyclase CrtY [Sphingomonadaceae bacterium]